MKEQRYRLFWTNEKTHLEFRSAIIYKSGKGSTIKKILEYLEIFPATGWLANGYDWRLELVN